MTDEQKIKIRDIAIEALAHSMECDKCMFAGLARCNVAVSYAEKINAVVGE